MFQPEPACFFCNRGKDGRCYTRRPMHAVGVNHGLIRRTTSRPNTHFERTQKPCRFDNSCQKAALTTHGCRFLGSACPCPFKPNQKQHAKVRPLLGLPAATLGGKVQGSKRQQKQWVINGCIVRFPETCFTPKKELSQKKKGM